MSGLRNFGGRIDVTIQEGVGFDAPDWLLLAAEV